MAALVKNLKITHRLYGGFAIIVLLLIRAVSTTSRLPRPLLRP